MRITTILPVSRVGYLYRVLDSLKTNRTHSLIVVFDGNDEDYLEVRNRIVGLDYQHVLCVKSNNSQPAFAIPERREHIANIHNQIRQLVGEADWIFSVEDDGIIPPDALKCLKQVVNKNVGMVTGVELGRWGVPYVGAWRVDNIENPRRAVSMPSRAGEPIVEEIDACGLYCALIRADLYKSHNFDSKNGLGPDVNLGLYIRQNGYFNCIDWRVCVTHLTNRAGIEMEIPATDLSQSVGLTLMDNNLWQQTKYAMDNTHFKGYN